MAVSPLATAVSRGNRRIDALLAELADELRAALLAAGDGPLTTDQVAQAQRHIDAALDRLYGPHRGHGGTLGAAIAAETTRTTIDAQRRGVQPVDRAMQRDRLLALLLARAAHRG